MIEEIGRCPGIENYSRHLSGRPTGEPPPTLLEYFPKDWLLIVDESHVAMPQVSGMHRVRWTKRMTEAPVGSSRAMQLLLVGWLCGCGRDRAASGPSPDDGALHEVDRVAMMEGHYCLSTRSLHSGCNNADNRAYHGCSSPQAVRQWVLTLPWSRRWLLARKPALARGVHKVVMREIQRWMRESPCMSEGCGGHVTVIQRFGSLLSLNLYFHALVLDGLYVPVRGSGS